jgi:hypothetical protein
LRDGQGVSSVTWLLLESLLALVVLVAIVAWTIGPLKRRRPPSRELHDQRDNPPSGE